MSYFLNCQNLEKTKDPIPRRTLQRRAERQTEGQTIFYKIGSVRLRSKRSKMIKNVESLIKQLKMLILSPKIPRIFFINPKQSS